MKMPAVVFIFISYCILVACNKEAVNSGTASEETKFLNFTRAVENISTLYYFTVVKVKDLNTGEIKEVCTPGMFVYGALEREYGYKYKKIYEEKKRAKSRYFEFRNKEALENISFYDYDPELVKVVSEKYNIHQIVDSIKKNNKFGIDLDLDLEEIKAMAHALFNEGYLTGENACFGGGLIYISEAELKAEEDLIKKLDKH